MEKTEPPDQSGLLLMETLIEGHSTSEGQLGHDHRHTEGWRWSLGLTSRLMGGRYQTLHTMAQLLIILSRFQDSNSSAEKRLVTSSSMMLSTPRRQK
ncbi:hypothetical protein JZ751_001510 [Albula glossodonta]|uniref:Uncharacterized protein n=1 Tax=Albula glossodonta TaxID=121402 RepID=A0A8T2PTP5_9TELE|nr:hypothetical protein JZ751_001510 [Albula glossodonta]